MTEQHRRSFHSMLERAASVESAVLDDESSDRLFEQLMARVAVEQTRRRRQGRLWRLLGALVGGGLVAVSAVRLLIS